MKKIFLFLMIFLIIPAAIADITILTEQGVYNLGNKIKASASILYDANFDGLFKMTIYCNDYRLQYYTIPISLEANSRTAVDVPELTVTSSMLGNCAIKGELTTNENLIIEEKSSNQFEVTHKLKVLPVNSKITSLPSESIKIVGVVNEAFGNNILKASVKAMLDNSTYQTEAIDGKFAVLMELPKNIKSGKHIIEVIASDSKNNMGNGEVELEVIPIPSYIRLELSEYVINPGTKVGITASLYDQADDLVDAPIGLEMAYGQEKIFTKTVKSNEKIDYEFSQYSKPGDYAVIGTYNNLQARAVVNISTLREVKIKYENQSVLIENIGNVPFIDELTLVVQNDLKKYFINKKVDIEPGKFLMVDLSKEVSEGVYNVVLPFKESLNLFRESLNLSQETVLANEVSISDKRPVYKKLASSLSSISIGLVGTDGLLTKNPLIAPAIIMVILLLLIVRYGRKPIMGLFKRKKPERKEEKEN